MCSLLEFKVLLIKHGGGDDGGVSGADADTNADFEVDADCDGRHVDEEAQGLLADYRDGRAKRKVMDSKGIYKRCHQNHSFCPSLSLKV